MSEEEVVVDQAAKASCPSCGEALVDEAKFCEACGQDLNAQVLPACVSCGEQAVGDEGYCQLCGHKQPAERDHKVFESGTAAAVTNRGRRHRHNEDAVAIGQNGGAVFLLVCDGVSSTSGSAEASLRSVIAARDSLAAEVAADTSDVDVVAALHAATAVAQAEASDSSAEERRAPHEGDGPPSSTFVALVAQPVSEGYRLSVAWIGDSRAYWLGSEAKLLTVDHEIEGSLTRWLGADSANVEPDIEQLTVPDIDHLVVCSDGLWRYASSAEEMTFTIHRLISEANDSNNTDSNNTDSDNTDSDNTDSDNTDSDNTDSDGAEPADRLSGLALASALVDFANESGGHDNISVALWSPTTSSSPNNTDPDDIDSHNTDSDDTDSDDIDPDDTDSDDTDSDNTDPDNVNGVQE